MPIAPKDVIARKTKTIPQEVFDAFDELIVKHWDGKEARFSLDEALDLAIKKLPGKTGQEIINNRWLDVEGCYEKVGWRVQFDSKGYNEDGPSYFVFRAPRMRGGVVDA